MIGRIIGLSVVGSLLAVGVAAVGATPAGAATLTVTVGGGGGSYAKIQAAIDAAHDGDTINVGVGNFTGSIRLDKYVKIIGAGAGSTILRSSGGTAVLIQNVPFVPGLKAQLSKMTITDGVGPSGQGGGITITPNADPEISDNVIEGNQAQTYGGGISVYNNSNPTIRGNTIRNNRASAGGAGIFVVQNSSAVIAQNTITDNHATGASITNGGSSGGAIYLENTGNPSVFSYPVVIGNTITGNSADFAGGGIMMRTGVAAIVQSNQITGNTAAYGAGIHVETTGSNVLIDANTISHNVAAANNQFGGSGYGGGIAVYDHSQVTIRDNDLIGNRSSRGGAGVSVAESASVVLDSNTISQNESGPTPDGSYTEGGGVYVAGSTLNAYNNLLDRNLSQLGGGFGVLNGAKAMIVNNTLVGNTSSSAEGGAVFLVSSADSSEVSNNLFSANTGHQIFEQGINMPMRNNLFDQTMSGVFYNGHSYSTAVDMNGSGLDVSNNRDGAAGFTDAANLDFTIASNSDAKDNASTSVTITPADDRRNAVRQTGSLDIGAYESEPSPLVKQHVYRFWSPTKRAHFYTISAAERDLVASSYSPQEWRYEGATYDAFTTNTAGTIPLYRFYSSTFEGHFYTANEDEKTNTQTFPDEVWHFEGIAFYIYPDNSLVPSNTVFRFWSPDNRHHFYTASLAERDYVIATSTPNVWTYEGPRFKTPR